MKKLRTNSTALAEFAIVMAVAVLGVMVVAIQDKPVDQVTPVRVAAENTNQPQPVRINTPVAVTPTGAALDVTHDVFGIEPETPPQAPIRVAVVQAASATPTSTYQPAVQQPAAPVAPIVITPPVEVVDPPADEEVDPPADEDVEPPIDEGYGDFITIVPGGVSQSFTLNVTDFLEEDGNAYWQPWDPVTWSDDSLPEKALAPVYMVAEYDPLAEPTGHYGPSVTFHVRAQAFAEAGETYELYMQLTDPGTGLSMAITIPVYVVAQV